ncbi:outer membrane protein OmpA-like peptidoglycan-associated protein [Lewinella aquimaris]|uniref:Outer membrane protein OmpA-like peptidoglycan-associated protein n=1 Tax=Neolewinella aquimaris TaxID=1835722 RepID=A0A840EAH6_9BACT|nr:OmpA family protein [Neolewinella aquimaris]MBB4080555.1 outer membrane protein OmpA-like peptidoglycan-associated protein [Neolewinella aquimaris]
MQLHHCRLFVLLLLITGPVLAQSDIEGSSDHPLLTRYPESIITWYETEKYFEYNLATGPITGYRYIAERDTVAGQVYRIFYDLPSTKEEVSIGEVYIDYKRAMEQAGMTILAEGLVPDGGGNKIGSPQWIGIALASQQPPGGSPASKLFAGTATSGGTFTLIGRLSQPEGTTYVVIYGERHSKDLIGYLVDIIEVASAETGRVSLDPDYLAGELESKGTVSIYGIEFDFDSATLRESSYPVLEQIAAYLTQHPDKNLYVVGHTDMPGTLEYNRTLSHDRAAAVVQALENDHGIATGRLLPDGVAFLSPKSTNATEDGRALNRRVELVLRPN